MGRRYAMRAATIGLPGGDLLSTARGLRVYVRTGEFCRREPHVTR